jgi:hypothetical protein
MRSNFEVASQNRRFSRGDKAAIIKAVLPIRMAIARSVGWASRDLATL